MDNLRKLLEYQNLINDYIEKQFTVFEGNEKLLSAMKYSMSVGGKRIRPTLLFAFCEALGVDINNALPFAFAIECLHTSSLIHDDLPALDNDDMRRGKPSNHKVFGEDFAIIAGDALENLAYEACLENCSTEKDVKALSYIAKCTGFSGMLGGQAYDLQWGESEPDEQKLITIDSLKTSKLIKAPIVAAGILAGVDIVPLERLGDNLGIIFQFSDDLMDQFGNEYEVGKTLGKDAAQGKITAVSVYGKEKTVKIIDNLKSVCLKICDSLPNNHFVKFLIDYIVERNS